MAHRPIHVLHVSRFFHPHIGGTENHIASLAGFVAPHGVTSTVLATTRKLDEPGPEPRVPVHRIPVIGPDWLPVPYTDLRHVRDLVRGSDVVHVHDLRFAFELVTVLALAESVPLVLSSHGLVFHTARAIRLKELAWRSYYRALLSHYSVVICVSEADASLCRRAGIAPNVRVLANPVEIRPFLHTTPHRPGRGALLYYGRLAPNKGVERIAHVLAAAPSEWTLTIAGTGDRSYIRRLERAFDAVGDRCVFRGAIPDPSLASLMADHDCVLLPSRSEGFGLTLVEAMAAGVPVVASDIAPYREIAADSPVALVDFDDPIACVRRIEDAMSSWDSVLARERAAQHSWDQRGHDFVTLYQSLAQ